MTSYVTGSQGFIGSHLLKKLTGDVRPIPHDLISHSKLQPFDYFYFLSSYGNLASQEDENEIFKANVEDLIHILKQVKQFSFKSFVFISTSSVMLKTQTTYSRCKKAAEELLLAFLEKHNVPVCIIRPFSVTGVGEQHEHLIPTLLRSCLQGELVNFVAEPTHDFIDVEDLVDGILSLSLHGARGIYQLGTGTKYTNQQVLDIIEKVTGKKAKINKVLSFHPYDNPDWVSTNFKARGYGWLPKKTLEHSVKEMLEAYEKTN